MFYACEPCPYEYRVERRSATEPGRVLLGKAVAILYHGQPLGETTAFPAGLSPEHNRLRVQGRLRLRGLFQLVSGAYTMEARRVTWLR
jgi:hypothetical protein